MKKVFQTKFGKPGGNCFQACVASIFELELEDVPDFCNIEPEDEYAWQKSLLDWLNEKGWTSITVKYRDLKNLKNQIFHDCYLLVSGPGQDGINHCVIYFNGEQIHNPNKKGTGITPKEVDLIIPMNPAEFRRPRVD